MIEWIEEHGIELPSDCGLIGNEKVRVATKQVIELTKKIGGNFEIIGLIAAKKSGEWKPSSDVLRALPPAKRVVEVSRREAEKFIHGEDLEARGGPEHGYVSVKCGHLVVGCGFARNNVIENKVPKKDWIRQRETASEPVARKDHHGRS